MNRTVTPVVLSSDGRRHEPMMDGAVFPVDSIPLSWDRSNLLTLADDGLLLTGDSLVSQTAGNPIQQGADGGIYLNAASLIASGDKVLRRDGDALGTMLDLRYDQGTARLTLLGVNNTPIAVAQLPVAAGIFTAAEVLTDYTPPTGGPQGTYIHFQFETTDGTVKDLYINVTDLVDTYTAGNGVGIANNVIAVRLASNSALGFTSEGALTLAISALVSPTPGNGLKTDETGRLYSAITPEMLGPGLKLGEDGRIHPDLAAGLKLSEDGKITVDTAYLSATLAVGVSADEDNILTAGSDGRPYLPGDQGSL